MNRREPAIRGLIPRSVRGADRTTDGRRAAVIAIAVALLLAACGKSGRPVPPEVRRPAAVTDLAVVSLADGIELRWTNPVRRIDGSRLRDRDLAVVRVFRHEDAGTGEPKAALVYRRGVRGYTEITAIPVETAAGGTLRGRHSVFADRQGLTAGHRYTYVVLTEDSTGRISPPSARLSIALITPAAPPRDLVAEAGDAEARLQWTPPATLADGTPVSGTISYEVLRSPDESAPLEPLTGAHLTEPRFVDRGLENDHTYHYAVRALRADAGSTAVSAPSSRVAVTPVDVTPPSPPTELVAAPSEGTVRLAWRASPEPDVARYVVYRASSGRDFERIGSTTPPATVFIDRNVTTGRYRYAVTAEDTSSRRNESARSNEVTVSVP